MAKSNHQPSSPSWLSRTVGLRVLMVFCVALYSMLGTRISQVIVHDHDESNAGHHLEMHHAPDPHHDDHQDEHNDKEGKHHHHLSCYGSVAMASVIHGDHSYFQQALNYSLPAFDETCPTGPTFEIIKPPQVA